MVAVVEVEVELDKALEVVRKMVLLHVFRSRYVVMDGYKIQLGKRKRSRLPRKTW